jgi:c-di-GMP-binding flagellar brake protein YcgR
MKKNNELHIDWRGHQRAFARVASAEQRGFPRVRASLDLVVHGASRDTDFTTFDVSAGGMSFFSERYFNPFSGISALLSFPLPDPDCLKTILVKCSVVRIDCDFPGKERNYPYRVSVAFTSIDPLDQMELERFVHLALGNRLWGVF